MFFHLFCCSYQNKNTSTPEEENKNAKTFNCLLKCQSLINQDLHVLQSVEESLKNPADPSSLMNSCEFIKDVLLQDFPAEVFLQKPAIVLVNTKIRVVCYFVSNFFF